MATANSTGTRPIKKNPPRGVNVPIEDAETTIQQLVRKCYGSVCALRTLGDGCRELPDGALHDALWAISDQLYRAVELIERRPPR